MRPVIHFSSTSHDPLTCDTPCYDATKKRQTCICAGMNYNAGHDQALRNNLTQYHKIIRSWLGRIANNETAMGLIQLPQHTTINFTRNPA